MTDIQIRYWEHKENVRHNLATEQLTGQTLAETMRANRANEAINRERNVIQQQYNMGYLNEMAYHNRMTETETKRHNIATEQVQLVSAKASMLSASAAYNSSKAALQNAATNARVADTTIALNNANVERTKQDTERLRWEAEKSKHESTILGNKAKSPYESDIGQSVRGGVEMFSDVVGALGGLIRNSSKFPTNEIGDLLIW